MDVEIVRNCDICIIEFSSAMKKKEILPLVTTCMGIEGIYVKWRSGGKRNG